jgi:hypothetical protein
LLKKSYNETSQQGLACGRVFRRFIEDKYAQETGKTPRGLLKED